MVPFLIIGMSATKEERIAAALNAISLASYLLDSKLISEKLFHMVVGYCIAVVYDLLEEDEE